VRARRLQSVLLGVVLGVLTAALAAHGALWGLA
jgi:hypothetical protein